MIKLKYSRASSPQKKIILQTAITPTATYAIALGAFTPVDLDRLSIMTGVGHKQAAGLHTSASPNFTYAPEMNSGLGIENLMVTGAKQTSMILNDIYEEGGELCDSVRGVMIAQLRRRGAQALALQTNSKSSVHTRDATYKIGLSKETQTTKLLRNPYTHARNPHPNSLKQRRTIPQRQTKLG